jgi:hypothetical protein
MESNYLLRYGKSGFESLDILGYLVLFLVIATIIVVILILTNVIKIPGDDNAKGDHKLEAKYQTQVKTLSDTYNPVASAKRPITDLLSKGEMPEPEQCFINFYSLGSRYTGYIGPMDEGYWDPDLAVQLAVNAGCRVFVLEIDYLDECQGETIKYFPRIVVRDIQNKLRIKFNSNRPFCNSPQHSNIRDVCEKINYYSFASSCQNASDPVVIVLYFLRQPPGSYKSKTVLDYYSNVAKALSPFQNRLITNELDGGTFYRQKQEGKLLLNKITDYNGKVLIFSNANTLGFREVQTYSPNEDLDFLTNLRLQYTQTKLGVTESGSGSPFGILESAEDFMIIPSDRSDEVAEQTKLRWTICFSKDPSKPVPKATYDKITSTYGVNCVPIMLFDAKQSEFMFTDKLFKTYSYIPKPPPLRYIKPPIVVPAEPNPNTNANQGKLRAPTV